MPHDPPPRVLYLPQGVHDQLPASPQWTDLSFVVPGVGGANVQLFDDPNADPEFLIWQKPENITTVLVLLIGAGGGGASGGVQAGGVNTFGGGAGSAGQMISILFPAALTDLEETITVGVGGAGGAAQAADDSAGNPGADGGATAFGTLVSARGGGGGTVDGSASAWAPPVANGVFTWSPAGFEGPGGSFSTGADAGDIPSLAPGSGGAGGGFDAGDTPSGGGDGADSDRFGLADSGTSLAGGTGGAVDAAGLPGSDVPADQTAAAFFRGGAGGGGGGAGAAPGDGGFGGGPGGGGGGGGAARNGTNSGAGGDGADGLVIIISW